MLEIMIAITRAFKPAPIAAGRTVHFQAPSNIDNKAHHSGELRRFAVIETAPGSNRWNVDIEAYENNTHLPHQDAPFLEPLSTGLYTWKFDGVFARNVDPWELRKKIASHLTPQDRTRLLQEIEFPMQAPPLRNVAQ